ncbi:MAG TPA: LuxR C-terminal-related transcriptional regulator [Novosphingobium sp.]|nr:LuxR C-terminal-related transcriptional regulator [Novosphingobium sp.]
MDTTVRISLIDIDSRRRAAISHALAPALHVEPFEHVGELKTDWPNTDFLLINDQEGAIAQLMALMAGSGEWYPVIGFRETPTVEQVVQAVHDGAVEYLVWPFDAQTVLGAVRRARGRAETSGSARLREAMARSQIEKLTNREREVLEGVTLGLSNRLIGERLEISPRTVEIHRANILTKLGANHTSEAIRTAIEAGLAG